MKYWTVKRYGFINNILKDPDSAQFYDAVISVFIHHPNNNQAFRHIF